MTGGKGNDVFAYLSASDSAPDAADLILDFKPGADKIDLSALETTLTWSAQAQAHGVWITEQKLFGVPVTLVHVDASGNDGMEDMLIKLVGTRAASVHAADFILPTPTFSAPTATPDDISRSNQLGHVFTQGDFGFSDADGDSFAALSIKSFTGSGKLYYGDTLLTNGTLPSSISVADIDGGKLVYYRDGIQEDSGHATFEFTVQDDRAAAPNVSAPATLNLDLNIHLPTLFAIGENVLFKAEFPGASDNPYAVVFDVNQDHMVDKGDAIYMGAALGIEGTTPGLLVFSDPFLERISAATVRGEDTHDTLEISTERNVKFTFEKTTGPSNSELLLIYDPTFFYSIGDVDDTGLEHHALEYNPIVSPVTAPFNEIGDQLIDSHFSVPLLDLYFAG